MTFKEAFEAMKHGAKVKLPSWAGYWFWSVPAQSILMHTKDGNDIDIRQTEIPDYTFGNIGSDEWMFATGENCPALGGMNKFSFSEALRQVKKKRKVTRILHETEWHLQLAYGDYSFVHGREEFRFTSGVACMYKGNTKFIVCLKKKDASGNVLKEFNTSLASLPVLEGLETTEAVVAENPDIIEQILTKIEKLTQISPEDIASAVSAYMEANPIDIPDTLPNPQSLTITYGGQTYTYDGSEAVAITIETGGIERIEKLATDTTVTLEPNKLYVFPEMESLTYTIEGTGEVHFIFKSGATATRVVHPTGVNIGSFSVDANKVYEVSILEGLLTSQNWSVS